MAVYKFNPVEDERWDKFLESHPTASIFHTPGWIEALRCTYGYKPVGFTTSPPGSPLTNGIPFCQISSWLSGRRLVSLPFSDHCAPLVENAEQLSELFAALRENVAREKWKYVEIRAVDSMRDSGALQQSKVFVSHRLDLRPNLDAIFLTFHKDCVQRNIRRAEKANLTYEEGTSDLLLDKFYRLLLATRRKHGLPPQPQAWFRNLVSCLRDNVKIHVAAKDGCPIASILTLCHKRVLVYKYGCSDPRAKNLGGTHFLLWSAIQRAKNVGISEFDLGRSECDNAGLISFKDRWGTQRSTLTYFKFPFKGSHVARTATQGPIVKYVFAHVPDSVLAVAGKMLYKHVG